MSKQSELSKGPVWLDANHIDPAWIETTLNIPCESCIASDISNETRKSEGDAKDGATLRLTLVRKQSEDENLNLEEQTMVVKQVSKNRVELSKRLGLAREALFFSELADQFSQDSLPNIYYSYGDFSTGKKYIIMEDLKDGIDSGCLFGPGNPNNWKKDWQTIASKAIGTSNGKLQPTSYEVALLTFREMAKIHAIFWKDERLLSSDKSWLRGQEWLQKKNRKSWEASQQIIQNLWEKYLLSSQDIIDWDNRVRSVVEKAIEGISWKRHTERLHPNGNWTLVHGDFHPGNIMWMTGEKVKTRIKLIDWEMVGIGSGPQELGQYVISNMDPVERKNCERKLVKAYFDELQRHAPNEKCCSWEYCWNEYKIGGLERWIWFLVYFIGIGMGDWAQFFHDQISSFMKDHEISENCITQPRP